MSETEVIRSFRRIFKLDRRIYRIDRWQIPIPGGIPLLAIGYFAVVEVALLVLAALPIVGIFVGTIPEPLRWVILPLAAGAIGIQIKPDGRPAHRWLWSQIKMHARRSRTSNGRPIPTEQDQTGGGEWKIPMHWDPNGPVLQKALVPGPATVELAVPVSLHTRARGRGRFGTIVTARASEDGQPELLDLGPDDELEIRP